MGRPSAWKHIIEPNLEQVKEWREDGIIEKDIAKLLGIGYTTLNENKVKYPQLAQALKISKSCLVEDLEKSLYQIAKGGFTSKTVTRKYIEDVDGNRVGGTTEVTETIKEHTPQMAALAFSLKNLAGDKWQDRLNHTVDNEEMSEAVKKFFGVKKA